MSFFTSTDSISGTTGETNRMSLYREQHCGRRQPAVGRRDFLQKAGMGCGLLALGDLLASESAVEGHTPVASDVPAPPRTHFRAKAKSIVWLFMEGAPSSMDLFDPKPELDKQAGKRIDIATFNADTGPLMKSPFRFKRYGESGASVC